MHSFLISANPRLLGALRKTVDPCVCGGGGSTVIGVGMKEWMKRVCLCFTPSRLALTGRARETVSLPQLAFNSFCFLVSARDCTTFTLHDLADFYVESVTAAPH